MNKTKISNKVWQVWGWLLNHLVEKYTVWDDYIYDQVLIPFDIKASLAHANMLNKIWILTLDELNLLESWLNEILEKRNNWEFVIKKEQEDWHTAIEQYLTDNFGEVGKKIHTWRSRNDQSLVMMRLFMKDKLENISYLLENLVDIFLAKSLEWKNIPMPWYTHMQKAMSTSVLIWLNSYSCALKDQLTFINSVGNIFDQNPLWSASWFGFSNFNLDREFTSKLLWFKNVQENPIYCAFSRWFFENIFLQVLGNLMIVFGRFANDMMIFTMQETSFFSLPSEFTTWSSIMPQKKNYDLFEIIRWNAKVFHWYQTQVQEIIVSLWTWYHRDLQLTKWPTILASDLCLDTILLLIETIPNIIFNEQTLKNAMTEELYVTDEVYDLVNQWICFRDAYNQIKQKWQNRKI